MNQPARVDSPPQEHWRAALGEGRFLLQRAVKTGTVFFPPRVIEPGAGEVELEWIEASGLGTVYSATVIMPRPPAVPYNVVLVDLDEGPRLMSRVEGVDPTEVRIGMRVRARIANEGEASLILFDKI